MKTLIFTIAFLSFKSMIIAQCPVGTANIYSFTYNGSQYEIVKENLNWSAAAACAVTRGGKLAEINSQQEQDSIFHHVNLAGIIASNTIGWDGGGASYLWLGGNDIGSEGNWGWNGNNDEVRVPFWTGTSSGSPVGGLYSNWGNEPDNWNNQDGLGLAFTDWPLGLAGQWNDIFTSNELHYIIEFTSTAKMEENTLETFSIFPNPANNEINVKLDKNEQATIQISNLMGQLFLETSAQQNIDVSTLPSGIYVLTVTSGSKIATQRFVKD